MPRMKPKVRGGVLDDDAVTVPIQKKEGDTELVSSVRASELTLDRGAVGENDTIEFKVKRSEGEGGDQLLLTHAVVERKTERLRAPIRTMDVGTPPEKAVRLWLVGFEKKKRDYAIGTEVKDWRKDCLVPDPLKEAFALMRDVNNLEAVAGRYVVGSPYQPRLLPNAHMHLCDLANYERQLALNFGAWSEAEAWNNARNQVIANAATGLNNMENAPLFLWLPETHKENAKRSLLHRWVDWKPGAKENKRLVPTQSRKWQCLHNDVFHYCACSMA